MVSCATRQRVCTKVTKAPRPANSVTLYFNGNQSSQIEGAQHSGLIFRGAEHLPAKSPLIHFGHSFFFLLVSFQKWQMKRLVHFALQ